MKERRGEKLLFAMEVLVKAGWCCGSVHLITNCDLWTTEDSEGCYSTVSLSE